MKFIHALGLFLLLLVTSCQQPLPQPGVRSAKEPEVVWRVDASTFGDEERLAAVCLQGLANRGRGRVFVDYGNALRWMQIDYAKDRGEQGGRVWSEKDAARLAERYADVHDYWIEFYERQGLCRFVTVTMPELMEKLRDELKGVILYSNVTDDLAVAATMSGVRDAVPLSQALYDDWMRGRPYEKPVIFDVRSLYADYPAGSDRRLEAHRWMIEHVYPECDKSGAVSRDRTYGQAAHDTLVDIDLAVSRRWVTFDLSFMSEESRNREKKDNDQPHPVWGFDPPDKPLLMAILEGLDDWSPVYGWGRPYESALIRRMAIHRCVKICGGTANGSFFRYMPSLGDGFQQVRPHVENPKVEPRIYVTFMVNEGDTLKCFASLMNGGGWLQSERGKKRTGLHVVFQDGEYCLAHARHARAGIIQHQDVAAIQGRQFMLQQIFLGRVPVAHGIKNNNQVRPVLPDFIMQHFGGEDIIGEKRERAQGKEEGHQNP